ncbi:unnamed protein product [Fusarium venenatum]|uniref:Uncharacterized protein n=1 Tax=Fusarium venenatum TaxID=56646 RepID=A0A2L2T9F9_9HYPO|nr:uncharacterized protein FVRRES_05343 [Fusarium venenatum]CEI60907.1 unnamed protein product [Fusarium venenatum]
MTWLGRRSEFSRVLHLHHTPRVYMGNNACKTAEWLVVGTRLNLDEHEHELSVCLGILDWVKYTQMICQVPKPSFAHSPAEPASQVVSQDPWCIVYAASFQAHRTRANVLVVNPTCLASKQERATTNSPVSAYQLWLQHPQEAFQFIRPIKFSTQQRRGCVEYRLIG